MMGLSSRFSNAGIAVGCIMTGTKTSGAIPTSTPKNSGGVIPMMVNGTPEIEMALPRTAGVCPNRRFQYPWLIIATGWPFGIRSSSTLMLLPAAGLTPSNEK